MSTTTRLATLGPAVCVLLLAPACASSESARVPTDAVAVAAADGIRLTNRTDRPIYYAAFERGYSTRVMFAPCTDASRCPSIAPRQEAVIPFSLIGGYEPGKREAVVYWWTLAPAGAQGPLVQDMHSEVVSLVPGVR